jgi:hypothetical protein
MYKAASLTEEDIATLYYEGVLKDLYIQSSGYINRGTYAYPGVDYTPEEIASASEDIKTDFWYNVCLGNLLQPGGVLIGTYVNNHLVGLFIGFINDGGEYHLCNFLMRPDADGTRNFLFVSEYHNVLGEVEKSLGATVAYTYVDIGSPIHDSLTSWINYFRNIEESNVKNWGSMVNLGEVTQSYSVPEGETWDNVKSNYSCTFEKYKMEYY